MTIQSESDPSKWLDLYGNFLFRNAVIRVRNKAIAEDLVQDTLVSAIQAFGNFEGRASVKTWLLSILKNKAIDHLRKSNREEQFDPDGEDCDEEKRNFSRFGLWRRFLSKWQDNPEDVALQKGFLVQLEGCMQELPERLRRVFVLKTFDELSTEEVCKVLGVSATNIWVILHRARLRLRECIDKNWYQSGALKK